MERIMDGDCKALGKLFEQWGIDCIMAVPVSKKKEIKRGYNQAYVYAKEISRYTKIPMDKKCLVRVEDTKPQKEFVGIARKKNVENAFAIYEEKAKNIIRYYWWMIFIRQVVL